MKVVIYNGHVDLIADLFTPASTEFRKLILGALTFPMETTKTGSVVIDLTFDDALLLADAMSANNFPSGQIRRNINNWAGHLAFKGAAHMGRHDKPESWLDAWTVGGVFDWPLRQLAPEGAVPIVLAPQLVEVPTTTRRRIATKWVRVGRTSPHETGRQARDRLLSTGGLVAGRIHPSLRLPDSHQ